MCRCIYESLKGLRNWVLSNRLLDSLAAATWGNAVIAAASQAAANQAAANQAAANQAAASQAAANQKKQQLETKHQ